MTKFRIGDVVSAEDVAVRTGANGTGEVTGVRDHGRIIYIEFDHNPNISCGCSAHRVRKLTREERAVRIAKKAMRIRANA
jgi:hypothetical protein